MARPQRGGAAPHRRAETGRSRLRRQVDDRVRRLSSEGAETRPADTLTVEYALRQGADAADDRIVELITALPERADILVYTSDRRLRERVVAIGADVQGARVLNELLRASGARKKFKTSLPNIDVFSVWLGR